MGQKIRNLQHKLGHYRSRVSNKVASTISVLRTRSSDAYSFKTSIGREAVEDIDPADARARHLQLHNTIVRALLVDEVLYEPSRLLKKSRRAVAVITGADLVLVKMTKATTTASAAAPAAAAADSARACSAGGADGSSDGGTAADVAQATVLAQHELNKMVKCEAQGNRLELEFIVTSSARFKVSAAALGFSSSSADSGGLDTAAVAGAVSPSATPFPAAMQVDRIAPASSSNAAAEDERRELHIPGGMLPASRGALLAGAVAHRSSSSAGASNAANAADTTVDAVVSCLQRQQQPTSPVFNGSLAHRCTPCASAEDATASPQAQYGSTPPAAGNGSSSFHAWSTQRSSSGTGLPRTRSGSYARQLGSSMVQGASRSVSSSISNFRLVKTDDGDYWVCVESFTLQFRDATMCQLAASLLLSGRSSMRVALEWLKQGLPFSPEFAITHITELSNSRSGDEVLVAGPTPWGTELQLPDSWTDAIRTAQLPDEQPLMTPLEVPDGPAAFNLHLATPAGLAEATLLPEMLALLARQASPQHTAQLLAIPVKLEPILDSARGSQPEPPGHAADVEAVDAVMQQCNRLQQQQQAEQQAGGQQVATSSSKQGAHRSSTGNWMSLNASSGFENADSTMAADDAVVSPDEEEEYTEVETEETLESEAAFDEAHLATADDELMSCYDSCKTVGAAYQRSSSGSSTKGILKTKQQQGSTSMQVGDVAAVDDTAMAAALCSPRHRVGWSPDLTKAANASNIAHQAQGVEGRIYSDNNKAASSATPRHQQWQLKEQPSLEQHHQSHQSQQRIGLRSKATRAAKKLLRRVVTPRRLGRTAADRTYSGPPGSQDRWYGSSTLTYRRSKSNPEGMIGAAAAVAAVAVDRSGTQLTAPGTVEVNSSLRVHRFGSSGELLPVHAGGMQLADEAMPDAADTASAAVDEGVNAVGATQWPAEAQHQQQEQQQQLRHSSAGSAVSNISASASEDSSALQNSKLLTRPFSSRSFRLKPEDQEEPKLSFVSEMYAVIHVQLVPCSGGSADSRPSSSTVSSSTAANPTAAKAAVLDSPFAAVASMPGLVGDPAPAISGLTPSVLVLGNHSGTNHARLTQQEQQLLSAFGLLAGILCGLGMLGLHTVAGRLLILAAALLNAVCLVGSAKPGLAKSALWRSKRSSKVQTTPSLVPSQSIGPVAAVSTGTATTGAFHSWQPQEQGAAGLAAAQQQPHTAGSPAAAADISSALSEGRLRLRLLGGGFMKEALGLLEEQILAYKSLRERAAAAVDAEVLSVAVNSSGDGALLAAADLTVVQQAVLPYDSTDAVVLISSPEPDWMTPDWRRRIFVARPNNEERRKVASIVHTFRTSYAADQMLKQPPPNFDFFQQHLGLKPLMVTPQGYVVVLLKMQTLVQMSRTVAAAGLAISDMVAHCGFLWSFMFEVLAPHNHPGGRIILVADMSNIKLGQAVGEGQIGARALGEVCFAWPERLCRCLVLGTPSWFNMLYRMVRPHLSPNTRAKVQVCDVSEGTAELTRCLGPELVPKEFGGTCALSYEDYPAQKQLLQFVAKLQQQQQQH